MNLNKAFRRNSSLQISLIAIGAFVLVVFTLSLTFIVQTQNQDTRSRAATVYPSPPPTCAQLHPGSTCVLTTNYHCYQDWGQQGCASGYTCGSMCSLLGSGNNCRVNGGRCINPLTTRCTDKFGNLITGPRIDCQAGHQCIRGALCSTIGPPRD